LADGGAVRFASRVNNYDVTVFVNPASPSVGDVEISAYVEDITTRTRVMPDRVTVTLNSTENGEKEIVARARFVGMLHTANLNIKNPGVGPVPGAFGGEPTAAFDLAVGSGPPHWLALALWIGLPIVPILLFAIREFTATRSSGTRHRSATGPAPASPA